MTPQFYERPWEKSRGPSCDSVKYMSAISQQWCYSTVDVGTATGYEAEVTSNIRREARIATPSEAPTTTTAPVVIINISQASPVNVTG